MKVGNLKIGDLVKWSKANECWHIAHCLDKDITNVRKRGIILDKNHKYFFVFWENSEYVANCEADLEVISESR